MSMKVISVLWLVLYILATSIIAYGPSGEKNNSERNIVRIQDYQHKGKYSIWLKELSS